MASEAGKGSTQRPTDQKGWSEGFDRIFGKGPRPAAVSWPPSPTPELAVACTVGEGMREPANDESNFKEGV